MDGPGRGGAPLPWDMEEPPANMFKEEVLILIMIAMIFLDTVVTCLQVRVVTVPHTGVVKACQVWCIFFPRLPVGVRDGLTRKNFCISFK